MEKSLKNKLLPIILTVLVIVLDQITKALVVQFIPAFTYENVPTFLGGLLRIIHVYNTGVAFSFGATWSDPVRRVLFTIIPTIVLILVFVVYFRNNDFNKLQRWCICGIIGGGFGNIIDRAFRPSGVVDFIDVQWFNWQSSPIKFFRYERFPTFNVADSAVVVCGLLLIISFIVVIAKDSKKEKAEKKEDK